MLSSIGGVRGRFLYLHLVVLFWLAALFHGLWAMLEYEGSDDADSRHLACDFSESQGEAALYKSPSRAVSSSSLQLDVNLSPNRCHDSSKGKRADKLSLSGLPELKKKSSTSSQSIQAGGERSSLSSPPGFVKSLSESLGRIAPHHLTQARSTSQVSDASSELSSDRKSTILADANASRKTPSRVRNAQVPSPRASRPSPAHISGTSSPKTERKKRSSADLLPSMADLASLRAGKHKDSKGTRNARPQIGPILVSRLRTGDVNESSETLDTSEPPSLQPFSYPPLAQPSFSDPFDRTSSPEQSPDVLQASHARTPDKSNLGKVAFLPKDSTLVALKQNRRIDHLSGPKSPDGTPRQDLKFADPAELSNKDDEGHAVRSSRRTASSKLAAALRLAKDKETGDESKALPCSPLDDVILSINRTAMPTGKSPRSELLESPGLVSSLRTSRSLRSDSPDLSNVSPDAGEDKALEPRSKRSQKKHAAASGTSEGLGDTKKSVLSSLQSPRRKEATTSSSPRSPRPDETSPRKANVPDVDLFPSVPKKKYSSKISLKPRSGSSSPRRSGGKLVSSPGRQSGNMSGAMSSDRLSDASIGVKPVFESARFASASSLEAPKDAISGRLPRVSSRDSISSTGTTSTTSFSGMIPRRFSSLSKRSSDMKHVSMDGRATDHNGDSFRTSSPSPSSSFFHSTASSSSRRSAESMIPAPDQKFYKFWGYSGIAGNEIKQSLYLFQTESLCLRGDWMQEPPDDMPHGEHGQRGLPREAKEEAKVSFSSSMDNPEPTLSITRFSYKKDAESSRKLDILSGYDEISAVSNIQLTGRTVKILKVVPVEDEVKEQLLILLYVENSEIFLRSTSRDVDVNDHPIGELPYDGDFNFLLLYFDVPKNRLLDVLPYRSFAKSMLATAKSIAGKHDEERLNMYTFDVGKDKILRKKNIYLTCNGYQYEILINELCKSGKFPKAEVVDPTSTVIFSRQSRPVLVSGHSSSFVRSSSGTLPLTKRPSGGFKRASKIFKTHPDHSKVLVYPYIYQTRTKYLVASPSEVYLCVYNFDGDLKKSTKINPRLFKMAHHVMFLEKIGTFAILMEGHQDTGGDTSLVSAAQLSDSQNLGGVSSSGRNTPRSPREKAGSIGSGQFDNDVLSALLETPWSRSVAYSDPIRRSPCALPEEQEKMADGKRVRRSVQKSLRNDDADADDVTLSCARQRLTTDPAEDFSQHHEGPDDSSAYSYQDYERYFHDFFDFGDEASPRLATSRRLADKVTAESL